MEDALRHVLDQQTGKHLFLFSEHARLFCERLGDDYEQLRKKWIATTHKAIKEADKEEKTKLTDYKRQLHGMRFEIAEVEISRFNSQEIRVKGGTNVRDRKIDIVHQLGPDPNISAMELFIICDMLNRSGAAEINVYSPMLPYQREDKKDSGRVPITASLFFRLLEHSAAGKLRRIATVDLHAPQAQGFATLPVDNLTAVPILARYLLSQQFHEQHGIDLTDVTIVSPDAGGAKRAKKLAELLRVPYTIFDKTRTRPGEVEYQKINGIQTPYAIWIDDMIDTGGTLVESANTARDQFGLKKIFAVATHGVFSPKKNEDGTIAYYAEKKLCDSGIQVITTDSIPRTERYYQENANWLQVISLADAFANLALSNRLGLSVSDYMKKLEQSVQDAVRDRQRTDMGEHLLIVPRYEGLTTTPARTSSNTHQ